MNIKKGIVYIFIANVINLAVGLFTGFVLPKLLSIETYSDIRLFQLYVTYLGILHFGFSDGMYLRHGGKNLGNINKDEVLSEFKTFKVFQLAVTVVAVVISLILQNKILIFCSLVILPVNVGNYLRNLYQAIGEFKKYSRFTNINTLLFFFINLILLFIVKSDDPNVYIVMYGVAYFAYWAVLELENRKLFGKRNAMIKREYLKSDVKTGFFLMTGNFCNVIFTSVDRLFVQFFMGKIKFAFYSFAVSIENLINALVNPISTVMYNYLCNNREVRKVRLLKRVVLLFGAGILLFAYPAKFIIMRWIPNYVEAIPVLFLLFASQFASIVVRCVHINLYKSNKKQNRYFACMVVVILISVILNLAFFNIFRTMEVIAVATLITNIVWLIIGEIDMKKYVLKIRDYIFVAIILGSFVFTIIIENAWIGLVVFGAVAIVSSFVCLPEGVGYAFKEVKRVLHKRQKVGE